MIERVRLRNFRRFRDATLAFTPGVRALRVEVGGEILLDEGRPTRVDLHEVRARAAEQAARLHARL